MSKFKLWLDNQSEINQKMVKKRLFEAGISKSTFYRLLRTGEANESTKSLISITLLTDKNEIF